MSEAATPPKKKKKGCLFWGLMALLAMVAIGIISAVTSGSGGSETSNSSVKSTNDSTSDSSESGESANAVPVGKPARDGKFEFTVSQIKCGSTSVGAEFLKNKAQGQFCLVKVKVKNIGDEAQMLDSSSQKAFDASGKEFSADGEAALSIESNKVFLENINPGNVVNGTIVFDVPKTTKLTSLELHDSPFSGGVRVQI